MSLTEAEIEHLAELARISLSDQDKKDLTEDLNRIVEFVDKLQSKKDDFDGNTNRLEIKDSELREDKIKPSLRAEDIKKIAPEWHNDQLVVPNVLDLKED